MKFNIKTNQVRNFIGSPAGFLTTLAVGGVVLAVAAQVGNVLSKSIERRKAREEAERNTIDNEDVLLVHPDVVTGEQPVILDEEAPTPESNPIEKINSMLQAS